MICLEVPHAGSGTVTLDIDLGADDEDDIAYDAGVDDIVINTGGIAAGGVYITNTPALTADDYLYLIEGDTAATDGVYDTGQVIVKLYGHPLLS